VYSAVNGCSPFQHVCNLYFTVVHGAANVKRTIRVPAAVDQCAVGVATRSRRCRYVIGATVNITGAVMSSAARVPRKLTSIVADETNLNDNVL